MESMSTIPTDTTSKTEDTKEDNRLPSNEIDNSAAQSDVDPDILDDLRVRLLKEVPKKLKSTVPDTPSPRDINSRIQQYNSNDVEVANDARIAAVWAFIKNEDERTKRQKPLLYIVIALTAIQLIAFNLIIVSIAYLTFQKTDVEIISQFFDILKYYIGATVVELIGMICFVTRGTFSSGHVKTLEIMLTGAYKGNPPGQQNGDDI